MDILIGLGYTVKRHIARGHYGEVFLGKRKDKTEGSSAVAIKIVDLNNCSERMKTKYIPVEMEVLKTFKHPHTILVHEIINFSYWLTVVMEVGVRFQRFTLLPG